MCEGSSSPIPVAGSAVSPGSSTSLTARWESTFKSSSWLPFSFDLPARAALTSRVDHRSILSHDPSKARRVVAKTRRIAHQEAVRVSEKCLEGIRILPAVMPGKNAAVCDDGVWVVDVHEEVAEVNAVAHPLVRNAAGKLFVEAKL